MNGIFLGLFLLFSHPMNVYSFLKKLNILESGACDADRRRKRKFFLNKLFLSISANICLRSRRTFLDSNYDQRKNVKQNSLSE